jgi:gliding motility-associated-like protein
MPIPLIVANNNSMCMGSNLEFNAYGGANYSWTGPNGFASGISNPAISNVQLVANGVYSLLVTTGPCTISATHSITVFPLPTSLAGANSPCDGKDLLLSGSGGSAPSYTFAWTGPQGYTSSLQNPVIVAATPTNAGMYYLLVTDINNCQANTSVQANVLINPIVLASGTTVCIYNPAVLTASGAVTYAWSGPNSYNTNGANANIPAATSPQSQVYTVIGSAANSCTSVATAVLNTIPLPMPELTVTPKACINSTISLEGAGGDFYEWRGPYNLFATTQNVTFKAVNLAHSGTYTLTVFSKAGCQNKDTRDVQVDPAPDGDLINSSGNSCVPFCADFSLLNKTSSPVVNTTWQVNGREFNSPTFTYCVVQAGDYVITGSFTNAIGCMNTSSFQVSGYPVPQASFDYHPDKPIESFDQVTFASTSKGAQLKQWNWYFINNGGYKTMGESINYTFEEQGTYPVAMVVKNSWGCADTVVRTVVVEPDFNVYVPTAFTPNADELNDVFQPKGSGVVKYSLIVYDRWGQKIFQSTDFSKGWDGTFKGEECKMDVYVWKIIASDIKGKTKNLNGSVTLYR